MRRHPPELEADRSRLHARAVPSPVRELAARLRHAGGQAWLVGGAVRDLLLGRTVGDWDLATDLLPDAVTSLFPRTVQVGARFGTVLVLRGEVPYEVTTFRSDGVYSDARRPDEVRFSQSLEVDLIRRDFTINALAYDPENDTLVDPTGGWADLEAGLLRAVGDPQERFEEDGLRLMRAVRFAAQLGFDLEPKTYQSLILCAPRITLISQERIRLELDKLILAPYAASALSLLHETGLLRRVLPELHAAYGVAQNAHHAYDVFHHTLAALQAAPADNLVVRLAVLFHDLGKPETRVERDGKATFYAHQMAGERLADQALRRLRYANEERQRAAHLVRHHMFHYRPEWTDAAIRRFLREVGSEQLEDLFAVRAADTLGNGLRSRLAPELAELRTRIREEIARANATTVRDLAINGHDLMTLLGMRQGPEIGRVLNGLLEEVLDDPARNTPEWLLERARALK